MPANLTPEYHRAEDRWRAAKTVQEKIEALEEMLRVIPKHKGTDALQGDLRARLAKLRKQPAPKTGRASFSHAIPKEGAGQVVLVGPPNSGKSSLVATLTHAKPEVAEYPFTTRDATPGMMQFEDVGIQLVDLPPLSDEHVDPWIYDVVRAADLLWIVLDGEDTLDGMDRVRRLLDAKGIELRSGGAPPSGSAAGRTSKRALIVVTGLDRPGVAEGLPLLAEWLGAEFATIAVSVLDRGGLDELGRRTFEALDRIRVYTKKPGHDPDRKSPFSLPRGAKVGDLAEAIHKDLPGQMKCARIWGPSAFEGQTVQRDHVLAEGDVVEIHL